MIERTTSGAAVERSAAPLLRAYPSLGDVEKSISYSESMGSLGLSASFELPCLS
jgi:hypothetical protein